MKKLIITSLSIIGILEFCGCSSKKEQIIYPKLISTNNIEQVKVIVNKTCEEGPIERQIENRLSNTVSSYLYICKNYYQPESYAVTIKESDKDGLSNSDYKGFALQDNLNSNKKEFILGRAVSLTKENGFIIVNIEK